MNLTSDYYLVILLKVFHELSWSLMNYLFELGAVEFKLFVGSLNKQATEREVEEVCSSIDLSLFVLFV